MTRLARIAVAGALLGLTVVMGLGPPGAQHTASAQGEEVDLSVSSTIASAPTEDEAILVETWPWVPSQDRSRQVKNGARLTIRSKGVRQI